MHRSRSLFLATAIAGLALGQGKAWAQSNPGFAANEFEPAEKGSDWFTNESLDFRNQVRPAIGVIGEVASDPIRFSNPDGSNQGALISSLATLHLGASLSFAERLRLGISLPLAVYQNGQDLMGVRSPEKAAIGDLRLGADVRLFGDYKDAFTTAVGVQAWVPTGPQSQFGGDDKARVAPHLLFAGDLWETIAYSARVGYQFRARADSFVGRDMGDQITGGAAIGIRAFERHLLVGPEVFGSTLANHAFHSKTSPGEVLLGAHYKWSDWHVSAGIGTGLTDAYTSPNARFLVGLEWSPAIPEPPKDRDGDGVTDDVDACPDTPGVKTDDPKTNGCPEVKPPSDRDGDGVLDDVDACPDTPGIKTDDPKTNGCPPPKPADRDGDGVPDDVDACPDTAGVKTDDPKTNGCPPPPPDRDGDGIPDAEDACPDQAGVKSEDPKKNGCPALAVISQGQIKIAEQVKFKTGSAEILKDSDELLTAVLQILKDHPEIKVKIEGHTDNKGKPATNLTLSKKRAASVSAWLQLHGIDKGRLSSDGFGQTKPIDTNDTDAGRQNNRRVEFHIQQ